MGLFAKHPEQPKPVAANSVPFFDRIPVAIVTEKSVILQDFSKLRSFAIKAPQIEGIDSEAIALETSRLDNFLRNLSTPNAFLQFTVVVNNDLDPIFNNHKKLIDGNLLLKSFSDEKMRMLGNCVDYNVYLTIVVPCISSVTIDGKRKKQVDEDDFRRRDREMDDAAHLLLDTLEPLGYEVRPLGGFEFMSFLANVINPGEKTPTMEMADLGGKLLPLNRRLFVSDYFVQGSHLTNGRYKFASLIMDILPDGATLPPMAGSYIMRDINFPVLFNYTILNEDQQRVQQSMDTQRVMAVMFSGRKSSAAIDNATKVRTIDAFNDERSKERWKLLRVFSSFLVWDEDEKTLHDKISAIRSACAKHLQGAGVFTEWLRRENAFVASLPGCATRSYDMLYTSSEDAAKLIPLRMHFAGDRDEPVIMVNNRWGSITCLNPFSKKQNKWGGVIIGPTGSGKSNFMNEMILSLMAIDPFIAIFDMAKQPSFDSLVEVLGGSNITVTMGNDSNRVNMFDLRLGFDKPVGSKIMSLDAILTQMIINAGESALPKNVQSLLQTGVSRMYERYFSEEPKKVKSIRMSDEIKDMIFDGAPAFEYLLEYRDFWAERFLQTKEQSDYNKAEVAQSQATPTLTDFISTLSTDEAFRTKEDQELADKVRRNLALYATGPQSSLFNGVTNLVINNDVYNFHLGLVIERKETLRLLVLLYRDFIVRKSIFLPAEIPPFIGAHDVRWIAKKQMRPKYYLYDEVHNLSDDPIIWDVLDKDARMQRTLNLSTYLATQKILDITTHGKSFLGASSNKFFTRHLDPMSPNMSEVHEVQKALGLNDDERKLLEDLQFYPGQYAEILALCEGLGKGIIKSVPSPQKRWLFTTHKAERYVRTAIRNAILDKCGGNTRKATATACLVLADTYPNGGIETEIDIDHVLKILDSRGYC